MLASDMINWPVFTSLNLPSSIECHFDIIFVHKRMNGDRQNPGTFSVELNSSPSLIVFTGNIASYIF